jgi:dolichyl-diphosphooligosaccharide--protein glycosyltransferase/undecaprenyl-diphosphooligosaccharide--protein glycosyltransferase
MEKLSMTKEGFQVSTWQLIGLMVLAYIFSFTIRLIWVFQFQDNPSFMWNNELMINTNDGYFFAAGAQQELFGMHAENPRVFGMWDYGVIAITTLLVNLTGLSLDTIILYMPALISSLVVIPIILIGRLYGQTLWGFFAALLGAITWSYYNRTMVGYYDTDMFSAMAPMIILFFLMKSTLDLRLSSAFFAAVSITIYPFLYDQGLSIVYAMGIVYLLYMFVIHRNEKTLYLSLIIVFISLFPLHKIAPEFYLIKLVILFIVFMLFSKLEIQESYLKILTAFLAILFLFYGNVFGLILAKVTSYLATGTVDEGLRFYAVKQTVREAGSIPFSTFANRTSGSITGVIIALIGYVVLVARHRSFILALPLIGIGIFALWGGLRFTVYAVPVAALSAIYLFFVITEMFKEQKWKYPFIILATALMIYPNVTHIIDYKVPTVLNKDEVKDLEKLNKMAGSKDYTLTWWDYGYPVWYYSETSTLIDGGKHNEDNYIISKILQTSSQNLAANLSRLAVEAYVESDYRVVANELFKEQKPATLLRNLEKSNFKLPEKTRDVYLYLPFRMMRIFPTVCVFGNINLMSGKKERTIQFYPSPVASQQNGKVLLRNGIVYDALKGEVRIGSETAKVYRVDVAKYVPNGKTRVTSTLHSIAGEFCLVYLESYGQMVVMDRKTYESAYVQMFMLEKYDKNLFELVVSSPYSKIFKLKK